MPRTQASSRSRFREYMARFEEARRKARSEGTTVTWHGERSTRAAFETAIREQLGWTGLHLPEAGDSHEV